MSERDLKYIDWQQIGLNFQYGGPPCFAVLPDTPDRYCCRAKKWEGHGSDHDYISIEQLFHKALAARDKEIAAVLDAVEAEGTRVMTTMMCSFEVTRTHKAAIASIRERLRKE